MKKLIYLILILNFCSFQKIVADSFAYSDSLRLRIESKNYIIIHFHDWGFKSENRIYKMMTTNQNPFTKQNNYAYIECIEKSSGKVLFKKPCSALSKIEISEDEKYIIGISDLKRLNPYQLLIYTTNGELIKKRHIAGKEAKLDSVELSEFKIKFAKSYSKLKKDGSIYQINNYYCIDFIKKYYLFDGAWDFLYKYRMVNHLSFNLSESVTNWIFWYYEEPDIKFHYLNGEIYSISLLDHKQNRIEILIKEKVL